jgi:hypothetical protein
LRLDRLCRGVFVRRGFCPTESASNDGKENKLPAGSYFSFKGKKAHMTKCEAGADCVLSMDARGKWDVVPEEGKPAAKK